jgi:hypothetical protein
MSKLLTGLVAFCLLTTVAGVAVAAQSTLIEFALKDQFGAEHTQLQAAGKVVFILGSDGDGSEFNDAWGQTINEQLAGHPQYQLLHQLPYADLSSVPFFAKGIARGMMPEEPESWVLTDWKGRIAKAYDFRDGATNMLVFAPDGTLTLQVAGTQLDQALLQTVISELSRQLDTAASK